MQKVWGVERWVNSKLALNNLYTQSKIRKDEEKQEIGIAKNHVQCQKPDN